MQATSLKIQIEEILRLEDEYLGFGIRVQDDCYVAIPLGWRGEVIIADSMPALRKKVWKWWHQVQ